MTIQNDFDRRPSKPVLQLDLQCMILSGWRKLLQAI